MDDWLWFPLLDPARMRLALGVLVLLFVCGTLSLWPVRFPGEVAPSERRRLRGGDWLGALLAWGVRGAPLLLLLGVGLVFFPVSSPRAVFLSSRARPADAASPEERWAELVRGYPEEGLDLGPVVDAVCDRLPDDGSPAEAWRPDDPALRQRVRETLRQVLAEADLPCVLPTEVTHRAEARLPRWLVETVELAALKAQGQRANVSRYFVLASDRKTDTGHAWDALEAYLQAGAPRCRPAAVSIGRWPEESPTRLQCVTAAGYEEAKGWVVHCVVVVPAGEPGATTPVTLRLQSADGKSSQALKLKLPLQRQPGLCRTEVAFPDLGPREDPSVLVQVSDPTVSRLVPSRRPRSAVVRLRVDNPEVWLATWDKLQHHDAFEGWRDRMRDFGYPVRDLQFSTERGGVVLDTEVSPGSVWVYPAGTDDAAGTPRLPPTRLVPGSAEPARARRARGAEVPGAYSWDDLPLRGQEQVPQFREADGLPTASRRAILGTLEDGAVSPHGARAAPLVTRHRLRAGECTHMAFDPLRQDALLPLDEPARAAVVWRSLLEAFRRSEFQAPPEGEQIEDAPQLLLESADVQSYRAEALAGNLLPLSVGLLLFAGIVARGIAGAPATGEENAKPE